jgi:peptidoglycan hydrolase-like protein with peptidoglycan-binding domain
LPDRNQQTQNKIGENMSFYLLDNPPASQQFWASRNGGLSGGVVVHTTEGAGGDDSAENTAGFISRRNDPGSYHCLVDTNSTVMMMPDDYTAFGVAASGYNSRCWMIAIAARSTDIDADNPYSQTEIDRCGAEIAAFWQRNGFDPIASAQWIGEGVKNGPGLACHGDVQPWDRSDSWSRHPQRGRLDQLLVEAIIRHASGGTVTPPPFVPAPSLPAGNVYTIGSTGDKVKQIQKLVGVPQDGVYGPLTASAVTQWQSNLKVPKDGVWGPQTQTATDGLFTFLSNLQAVSPTNPFFEALNSARQQTLRSGSSGGSVKILQAGLNGIGYALITDGVFGPATENAVRRFQADNGLQVDGICGPQTWDAIIN